MGRCRSGGGLAGEAIWGAGGAGGACRVQRGMRWGGCGVGGGARRGRYYFVRTIPPLRHRRFVCTEAGGRASVDLFDRAGADPVSISCGSSALGCRLTRSSGRTWATPPLLGAVSQLDACVQYTADRSRGRAFRDCGHDWRRCCEGRSRLPRRAGARNPGARTAWQRCRAGSDSPKKLSARAIRRTWSARLAAPVGSGANSAIIGHCSQRSPRRCSISPLRWRRCGTYAGAGVTGGRTGLIGARERALTADASTSLPPRPSANLSAGSQARSF